MKVRCLISSVIIVILSCSGILNAQDGFRVWPYLQNPASDKMTVVWFSEDPSPGQFQYREQPSGSPVSLESSPVLADALAYSDWEEDTFFGGNAPSAPYQHKVRLQGLQTNTFYDYTVVQGSETFSSSFRTAPDSSENIRFIVYSDSETEPESAGSFTGWADPVSGENRPYLVDQEVGYRNNLDIIRSRDPNVVIIAGDLVEIGGEQRDWTDFWAHNTNSSNQLSLGGRIPILAALGNHDYSGGPHLGGSSQPASENAVSKYLTYFDYPPNLSPNPEQEGRYYRLDYGPVSLIVLDLCNNGSNGSSEDTNFYLLGEDDAGGGHAPSFTPGSNQYTWLEEQLTECQRKSKFTFVFFHHSPYSSGPHGYPPGWDGNSDDQSGVPVRALSPLFMRYGVDAVISGHDEMLERSELHGLETTPSGIDVPHSIQFYDVGIGGDGLRSAWSVANNEYLEFLVHRDVPETWQGEVLLDGGKHYGHLEVDILAVDDSTWQALLTPVYIFHITNPDDLSISGYERRVYNDQIVLTWNGRDPDPICLNETSSAASGLVSDNSGDEDYMNDADCRKLIQPAGATEITLNFTAFNLENGYDYVRVYEGSSTSDPLLGEFTGTTLPDPVTSFTGSMLIHFTSNGSISAPGWSAAYTSNAPDCGPCLEETYTTPSGELSDNSCDGNYLNDTDCRKLIQPVGAEFISLSFTAFDLEAGYDFVRVYDGATTSDPLLGEFSGSAIPGSITSSGGSMLLHFTSDYSITARGWEASYEINTMGCGSCISQTHTESAGAISDNSCEANYPNLSDCRKLIQPVGADFISLTFTEFDLEAGYDFVRVYDGATTSDPLLGEFSGSSIPGIVTSSGESMLIHFTSDYSITRGGWSADYASGVLEPVCNDETFTTASGLVSDNSGDEDYMHNADCRKLIQPEGATEITLTFTEFNLENGNDHVRVYAGPTSSDPLLGEFTGATLPDPVTSNTGSMLIHFSSNGSISASGWAASYTSNAPDCGSCLEETYTAPSGELSDNSCDGDYLNDTDCRKLIQPAGVDHISLTFTEFDLEAGYDFVRVYDGTSSSDPLLGEFSGSSIPGTITSSGGSMLVHFTSDYSITRGGWSAEYAPGVPDPGCISETFSAASGILTDNSGDEQYMNNADCQKLIQPLGAEFIRLTFTAFDLEAGYDFVRVYDGASTSDPLLGEFSGSSIPGPLTSSGGSMLVHFTSDYSITARGWEASYEINTMACGPCVNMILTESTAAVSDNSCEADYQNFSDCQKLIQPTGADYITLAFTDFDLEAGYDFVRVYDGASIADPLLGEFSGSSIPGPLTSSGGSMLIHFTSDYSITRGGWSAGYVSGTGSRSSETMAPQGLILDLPDKTVMENRMIIYPNPTNDKFSIQLANVAENELILRITDPSGKVIVEKIIHTDGKQFMEEVDFSDKAAGIYFIQLNSNSYSQTGKLIVY